MDQLIVSIIVGVLSKLIESNIGSLNLGSVDLSKVSWHIGLTQLTLYAFVFIFFDILGISPNLILVFLFGSIGLILGYMITASSVEPDIRNNHMIVTALGTAIVTILINAISMGMPENLGNPVTYIVAAIQNSICLGIALHRVNGKNSS